MKRAAAWLNPKSSNPVSETAVTSATHSPNRGAPSAWSTTGVVTAVARTPQARARNWLNVPRPTRGALRSGAGSDTLAKEAGKPFKHKLQHFGTQTRVDSNEEAIAHHPVGIDELAGDAHRGVDVCRLLHDVAAKDIAGL